MVSYVKPNDLVGEIAVLTKTSRTAIICITQEMRVFHLSAKFLVDLCLEFSSRVLQMLAIVAQRFEQPMRLLHAQADNVRKT